MRIAQVAPLYESVPPEAVRRHGACRLLSDRGTGAAGARGHAVRQRRLADAGQAGRRPVPGALWQDARLPGDAAAPRPAAGAGLPGRAPASTSSTSTATTCTSRCCGATPARASPPCTAGCTPRTCSRCSRSTPKCRSSPSPTTSAGRSRGQLAGDRLPRPAPRPAHLPRAARRLPRLPRPHLPEKRLDRAIEIARRAGMQLKVAAKIYPEERDYFEQVIEPLLQRPAPGSSSSARSAAETRTSSSATPTPCCFPSTGRSRSAWS